MSRLLNTIAVVLALNFLAAAGGVGWLVYAGHLDRERVAKIREILFPPPAVEAPQAEAAAPATQPAPALDQLLARFTGFSTAEKLEQTQHAFDAQLAQLERRRQELAAQLATIEQAKRQLALDREQLAREEAELRARQEAADRLAEDKGFQDSLALYQTMPPRQVKEVFLGLDDQTVIRYLQAMPPRIAGRIMKEFKSPEEIDRIQRMMELMRQAPSAPGATVSTEGP